MSLSLLKLRKNNHGIVVIGNYPVTQAILDYDYLQGKSEPSVKAIVTNGKKTAKYFFGDTEILIPVYSSVEKVPTKIATTITLFINLQSGRSAGASSIDALSKFKKLEGGIIFAENVPERVALEVKALADSKKAFMIGPASVGIFVPGYLKLGAIGGTLSDQIEKLATVQRGEVAVITTSGGMSNELVHSFINAKRGISFAVSAGGDRFSMLSPLDAVLAAEKDSQTKYIVYFGELGSDDEYRIRDAIKAGKIKKKLYVYIGGDISESFDEPMQFGHAKALAKTEDETAKAKRVALKKVGVQTFEKYDSFIKTVTNLKTKDMAKTSRQARGKNPQSKKIPNRKKALITSTISNVKTKETADFAEHMLAMLLGRKIKSTDTVAFIDLILKELIDHGPHVSGAVNTIISARAGKDLVSSVTSGLLTIGPRFGGALNEAAKTWFEESEVGDARDLVSKITKEKGIISGIGHRKYSKENPDPRVKKVLKMSENCKKRTYTSFALDVEDLMLTKKSSLILNIDGAIAAVMLDLLSEKEKLSKDEIETLIEAEFFNALFVIPRTIGFTAHFLDQKRIDEGLFRMPDSDVSEI